MFSLRAKIYKFRGYSLTAFKFAIIVILSNIIFVGISLPLIPDDYWWHVSIGKWIVENHSLDIPSNLSWLSSYVELNWIDHSWLCEIILYLFSKLGDVGALLYMMTFNILGYYLFIYRLVDIENEKALAVFTVFYFTIFQFLLAPRPYIMGFFFLMALVYNLEMVKNRNMCDLPFLIVTLILWANTHGGSIILAILFSLYYLVVSFLKEWEKSKIKKYIVLLVSSTVCSLINPYGIKSVFYILKGDVTTSYIPEWKSIFEFNQPFYYGIIITVVLITIAMIMKNDLENTLVILGLCALTCVHMRYIEYLIILLPFYLISEVDIHRTPRVCFQVDDTYRTIIDILQVYIYDNKVARTFRRLFSVRRLGRIGYILLFLGSVVSVMLLLEEPDILKKPMPDEILEVIKDSNRTYNDYDYGGYLIYNDIQVFWDSRADLYVDSGIFLKSFKFQEYDLKDIDMEKFILDYDFEYIVIRTDRKLNDYLYENSYYEKIMEVDDCILYKKATLYAAFS